MDSEWRRLPHPANAIAIKGQVIAHHDQIFRLRLCDQHSIKRVSLRPRQKARSNTVGGAQWKTLESGLSQILSEVAGDVRSSRKPSQTNLGRHFPRRDCANDNRVSLVRYQAACRLRQ